MVYHHNLPARCSSMNAYHRLARAAGLGSSLLLIELQIVVLAVRQSAGVEVLHICTPQLLLVALFTQQESNMMNTSAEIKNTI